MSESRSGHERAEPDATSDTSSYPSRRQVQKAHRQAHRHPWLRRGSVVLAGFLALLLVVGVASYLKFSGNITKLNITNALGKRPDNSAAVDKVTNLKPMNILVMGSDTRDLGTSKFGTTPGGGSDTNLLVHLAGDRKSAVVVSIPRDSMTRAPANCKDPKSKVADGPIRIFNANYGLGGPACVIRTVEGNTHIFIDHFMVVNFVGFESMVEALGAVEVCLPKAVNDKYSHLNLPAGRSRVTGAQALAFVRLRKVGDGSDTSRIGRQQAFLSAMVQEATSSSLLLRPDKLLRFLDAATKSLTTDPELGDPSALLKLAQSAAGLKPSQIRFVKVPTEPYPSDPNRLQWAPAASALWKSIHDDTPLPGSKPAPGPVPTPTRTSTPGGLSVAPDKITVRINNGSGGAGRGRQAAEDLRAQGFHIGAVTSSPNATQGVRIGYWAPFLQEARTVAAAFPGAILVQSDVPSNDIQVTLGAGSPYVVKVPSFPGTTAAVGTPSGSVTIPARSADSNICKQ